MSYACYDGLATLTVDASLHACPLSAILIIDVSLFVAFFGAENIAFYHGIRRFAMDSLANYGSDDDCDSTEDKKQVNTAQVCW